jgi:cytosine/uracil/thiamine/allantoin permease
MNYLLAQAAAATEPTPTAAQTPPADIRELTVWVAGVLIVFAITLAIWAMTKARTPLAGDHH